MSDPLILSRSKLTTFLACQRQFRLRYLDRLPWPAMPLDERDETAVTRGQTFHQLVQRHYLGLTIHSDSIVDSTVRRWWTIFTTHPPALPEGQRWPEMSLTVPIGDFLLNGRFDLLVTSKIAQDVPFVHLFDWKTGKPQPISDLRHDWQTRLYLGMVVEGYQALDLEEKSQLLPENVAITYWYVQEPDSPRTIQYSAADHQKNWQEINQMLRDIAVQFNHPSWPLTDTLAHCRTCGYQIVCGRQDAGVETAVIDEARDWEFDPTPIAPDSP
jgi:CRISPR/Cas system-associated exonuclease Cas4 (RecB family)